MTFTKDHNQLEAARAVPLDRLLLETDAPFLTPAPFRGELCEPKHVLSIADFLAKLREQNLEELAVATTANAIELFGIGN
jgi:TatD DNase family protein